MPWRPRVTKTIIERATDEFADAICEALKPIERLASAASLYNNEAILRQSVMEIQKGIADLIHLIQSRE